MEQGLVSMWQLHEHVNAIDTSKLYSEMMGVGAEIDAGMQKQATRSRLVMVYILVVYAAADN